MLYWRFSFLVVASNIVKWIQNTCHLIKFHTLFLSFCRIGFRWVDLFGVFASALKFLLWIRQLLFQQLETFLFYCLSGLLFSNFCIFRQNSMLAKALTLRIISLLANCLSRFKFLDKYLLTILHS